VLLDIVALLCRDFLNYVCRQMCRGSRGKVEPQMRQDIVLRDTIAAQPASTALTYARACLGVRDPRL